MSVNSLIRRLMTRAFRSHTAAPIRMTSSEVGRRIEELESRDNPVTSLSFALGVLTITPATGETATLNLSGGELNVTSTGGTMADTGAQGLGFSATSGVNSPNQSTSDTSITTIEVTGQGMVALGAANVLDFAWSLEVDNSSGSPGTFDLASNSQTVASVSGTGTVTDSGGAATFTVNNNTTDTFTGNITGANTALTLGGTGQTLILSGNNSYSGTTTINVTNTLQIGSGTSGSFGIGSVNDNGSLMFDLSGTTIVSNAISGSGSLTQSGPSGSIVILNGSNSYSGATTVTGGTLADGVNNALPTTTPLIVTSPGTFDLASNSQTVASVTGTGTVTDSGGAATFTVNNNTTDTFAGSITGANTALTLGGTNQSLTLSGNNTYGSATTINSTDTLTSGSSIALTSATNVTDNGTLDLNSNNLSIGTLTGSGGIQNSVLTATLTVTGGGSFSGNITGATTGLTVDGSNTTLTLSGGNTYGGATTVNAGTLTDGSATAVPSTTALIVTSPGTFDLASNSQTVASVTGTGTVTDSGGAATFTVNNNTTDTFAGSITGTNTALTLGGMGQTLILSGNNTYSGSTTMNVTDTLQIGSGTTGSFGIGSINDNGSLVFDLSGTTTVLNAITGSGSLTQSGPSGSIVILNGSNNYGGATTVTGGTLADGVNNALPTTTTLIVTAPGTFDLAGFSQPVVSVSGTGTVTDSGGAATFTVNNNTTDTFTGNITGANTALTLGGTGQTLILSGNNSYSGTTTINVTNTLQIGNGTSGSLGIGSIKDNGSLVFDLSSTTILPNAITGSGSLTQSGPSGSIVILNGSNSYSGATTVTGGTLADGVNNALPTTTPLIVTSPGTFDLASNSQTVASVTGTGTVTDSGGAATFTVNNNTTDTFAGSITGANTALTLGGTGQTLTLSGDNTYSGETTINPTDTLTAGSATALTGNTMVTVSGTLDLNGNSISIGALNGGGAVKNSSTTSGTLTVTNGGTFSGAIGGNNPIALTVSGTNTTLTLSGDNTYSGATTVNAGTLLVDGNDAATIDAVTVNGGGTLGGTGTIGGAVIVNTGGSVTGGTVGTVGTLTVGALSFNGGTYLADFNGNNSDTIMTSGAISLANASQGIFTVNSQSGSTTAANVYTLIDNTGVGSIPNPPLLGATEGGTITINGVTTYVTYAGGNGKNFTLTASGSPSLSGSGVLTVRKDTTNGASNIQLLQDSTVIDERPLASIPASGSYTITASAASTLTVDYSSSPPAPAGLFSTNINYTGFGSDTITVENGTFGKIAYNPSSTTAETIQEYTHATDTTPVTTITATGVSTLGDTSTNTVAVFSLGTGPNAATLADNGSVVNSLMLSGTTLPTTTFANPSNSLTINRGSAADTLTINVIQQLTSGLTVGTNSNPFATITAASGFTLSSGTGSLNLQAGTINLNATGMITTNNSQTYGGAVMLLTPTTLLATSGAISFGSSLDGPGSLMLTAPMVTFTGPVGSTTPLAALTVNATAAVNGGSVQTAGAQTWNGTVTLGSNATFTAGGAVTFSKTLDGPGSLTLTATMVTFTGPVGSITPLAAVTVNAAAVVNGGSIQTTGAQTWNGSVTLGSNTTFTAGGDVSFAQALSGGVAVSVTAAGQTTFGGLVSVKSLTTGASGEVLVNGGAVTTTSGQAFGNPVSLGSNTTFTAGGAVIFSKSLDGPGGLTLTAPTVTFTGPVGSTTPLTAFTVNATAAVNGGSVQTTGAQTWNGTVTLGSNTTFTAGGVVTFSKPLDGPGSLTLTAPMVTFTGPVGSTTPLAALTVNATAAVNGGSVQTTGAQTWNGTVTLGSNTTFTAGGVVTFSKTLDGPGGLTLTAPMVTFTGPVGSITPLAAVTANAAAVVNGGSIQTTGVQTWNGTVTLGSNTTFTAGGAVTFSKTLGGPGGLTLTAPMVTFADPVGSTTPLAAVTVDASATVNGGSVQTTGAQTWNGTVTLGSDTTFTAGGAVLFSKTLDGPGGLTLTAPTVTFTGPVGSTTPLAGVTVDASTAVNGGSVQTTGAQTWNGPVTLGSNTTFTAGGVVTFSKTLDGPGGLTLTAPMVTFTGPVGSITPLAAVTANAAAVVNGGSVQTTGAQTWNGTLTLGSDTTFTAGGNVTFAQSVTGQGAVSVTAATISLDASISSATDITLNPTSGGVSQTAGALTAQHLILTGVGPFTLDQMGNSITVGFRAAISAGSIDLAVANALTVDTADGGITTAGGNVTIRTGGDFTAIDQGSDPYSTPLIQLGSGVLTVLPGLTGPALVQFNLEVMAAHVYLGLPGGGNNDADTFIVRPSAFTPIDVAGNFPAPPLPAGETGDVLQVLFTGATVTSFQYDGQNGYYDFAQRQPLTFTGIETLAQFGISAFAVQTATPNDGTGASTQQYAVRVIRSQDGVTLGGGLQGAGLPSNPFVVSPALVNSTTPLGSPRIAFADVTGDGVQDLILANGPGAPPLVTVIDGRYLNTQADGSLYELSSLPAAAILAQFYAFDPTFLGGVNVAAGDFTGDGMADIVTAADAGGGPHIRTFELVSNGSGGFTAQQLPGLFGSFFAYDPTFRGGARVAVGDVNGDGTPDLIIGTGAGGGPRVLVYDGKTQQLIRSFYAYDSSFRGGIFVAAGDYSNDGYADILTGPGDGGSANIRVFSGFDDSLLASFFAFQSTAQSDPLFGVFGDNTGVGGVAFGALGSNGYRDILVGTPLGTPTAVYDFQGTGGTPTTSIDLLTEPQFTTTGPGNAVIEPSPTLLAYGSTVGGFVEGF